MLAFFLQWLVLSAAFWITAKILPGVKIKGFGTSILAAAVFAILSVVVGWLLFAAFTIGTLGLAWLLKPLTWWIIGAIVLKLTDVFFRDFKIDGFGTALLASAIIAITGAIGDWGISHLLGSNALQ